MIAARPATAAPTTPAIEVYGLAHAYGTRRALAGIDLVVQPGEICGLLGPNGGGKTTLFRVLATLTPPQTGRVTILGEDVAYAAARVRHHLGVVFQHPGLDPKLTVRENLRCHAALYGLSGARFRERAAVVLERLGVADRADERVETLSGGLARRAELAKGLLHAPAIVLLDEPTTGLDPGARRDFMQYLARLRERDGVTVVLTTHALDEAERCDRVAVVHRGALVAVGAPDALKASIGGDVVTIESPDPERLRGRVQERFGCVPTVVDGTLRVELPRGHHFVRDVVEAFPGEIRAVTYGKPTLADVFVHLTGHRFWDAEVTADGAASVDGA